MQNELDYQGFPSILSKKYWFEASKQFKDVRMITIAALIVALRVVVKLIKISIASGVGISLDAYVNSLGSLIYGPVVGLAVGAISDVLGMLVTGKMAEYFLPFILVEMASSFIFGLFFWKRKIDLSRTLFAKFSVNLVCNIVMTSLFMKWMKYVFSGPAAAEAYKVINGVRIAKNLVLFPLEAMIIVFVLSATVPILTRLKIVDRHYTFVDKPSNKRLITEIALFTALSVAVVALYLLFVDGFKFDFKITFN